MKELARALHSNKSITEMRLGNQRGGVQLGMEAEEQFANALGSNKNHTLLKLGLVFRSKAFLDRVDRGLSRNRDLARRERSTRPVCV